MKKILLKYVLPLVLAFLASFLIGMIWPINIAEFGPSDLFKYAQQYMFLTIGIAACFFSSLSPWFVFAMVLCGQIVAGVTTGSVFVSFSMETMGEFRYPIGVAYYTIFSMFALVGGYIAILIRRHFIKPKT